MTYCTKCGTEEVSEWTGSFDRQTGERVYRYVCRKDPCGHSGHDAPYGHFKPGTSWWTRINHDGQCTRCGGLFSWGW